MSGLLRGAAAAYRKLAAIPLVFLGIGLQRAWSSLLFNESIFPVSSTEAYIAGMVCTVVVNFALAVASWRIGPLYRQTWLVVSVAAFASTGTAFVLCDAFLIGTGVLSFAGTLLAMTATGASMLLWCEFFGSMNPTRVALYYAAAIVFGELVFYFLSGMELTLLCPLLVLMPVLNVVWAVDSTTRVRSEEGAASQHNRGKGAMTYPVALVALMASVSFTDGFMNVSSRGGGLSALLGTIAVLCVIVIVVLSGSRRVRLESVYRFVMPITIVAMLMLLPDMGLDERLSSALFCSGDAALAVMTMIVFSGMSYRFGMNAVWLNGIERGVRYSAYVLGWFFQVILVPQMGSDQTFVARIVLTAVIVLLFVLLFVPNSDLFSAWGVHLTKDEKAELRDDAEAPGRLPWTHGEGKLADSESSVAAKERSVSDDRRSSEEIWALRSLACDELASRFRLTAREQEVCLLLAHRMTSLQIEQQLVIAPGTLKAHVNHIYSKLGVHSRSEFYDLIAEREKERAFLTL